MLLFFFSSPVVEDGGGGRLSEEIGQFFFLYYNASISLEKNMLNLVLCVILKAPSCIYFFIETFFFLIDINLRNQ